MDDNTITEYGWVVIVVLVIAAALVLVPGLNRIIEDTTKEQINEPFEDAGETVTNYTRYDVDNSNGLLVAIGKNNALDVVARFSHDHKSVIVTKNGASSGGIMGAIPTSYRAELISVTIADGIVTIAQNAFDGCVKLKGIDIASSVKTIEKNAFKGCTALTSVVFFGTQDLWNKVTCGDGNSWKTEFGKKIRFEE